MQHSGLMREFHPKKDGSYASPNWIWSVEEFDEVIDVLKTVQTPIGYGSCFHYKFNRKLVGFKTHDYHNLLHDQFPIIVRDTLTKRIPNIIYKLVDLFQWAC